MTRRTCLFEHRLNRLESNTFLIVFWGEGGGSLGGLSALPNEGNNSTACYRFRYMPLIVRSSSS